LSCTYFVIFLQFLLDIRYCAKRLYIILNMLFKLFPFKDKYNKNKLLILDKINNFATNIKTIIKLIQQTLKRNQI